MDYQELRDRAEELRKTQQSKRHEAYHYARGLGFTAREAMLVQDRTKEEIDQLAKERDHGNGQG